MPAAASDWRFARKSYNVMAAASGWNPNLRRAPHSYSHCREVPMKLRIPERPWLLLVEDSPADVYLVQEAVRQEGLEFDWSVAEDGELAINLIDTLDADDQAP